MRNCGRLFVAMIALSSCGSACPKGPFVSPHDAVVSAEPRVVETDPEAAVRWLYRDGLQPGWSDDGYAPRDLPVGSAAAVDFSRQGGWILRSADLVDAADALVLDVELGHHRSSFLELQLRNRQAQRFPVVRDYDVLPPREASPGWKTILVPMARLNPNALPWDRLVIRASTSDSNRWVKLNRIGLLRADSPQLAAPKQEGLMSSAPAAVASEAMASAPLRAPKRVQEIAVDCRKAGIPISEGIYGISYSPRHAVRDQFVWGLRPSARRWGGNPSERFNWRKGNLWNTGSDWYFQNVDYVGRSGWTWRDFLRENKVHRVDTALTLPMLGWVARDGHSYSFPVVLLGPQQSVDPQRADIGNGRDRSGKEIAPLSPLRTSERMGPSDVAEWVRSLKALEEKEGVRVSTYMLGNEPMLWNSTHRDVHPEPVGYDDLLARTVAYAQAVREVDPGAYIAAPGLWGWPAYFYSAKDAAAGFQRRPDRRAHGDVPFLEWYLSRLHARAKETGLPLLNALDVHFYPEGGVYSSASDRRLSELRVRSVRSLWDGAYVDESWIGEPIKLLPRMREIIEKNYPGLDLVIGEYSFGGEMHMSGAISLVDALGRFAQHQVAQAYYWTYPKESSPAYWAFRAFRDFDGAGGRFLEQLLLAQGDDGYSLYVSTSADHGRVVGVAANKDFDAPLRLRLRLQGCPVAEQAAFWVLAENSGGLRPTEGRSGRDFVEIDLPPLSVATLALP